MPCRSDGGSRFGNQQTKPSVGKCYGMAFVDFPESRYLMWAEDMKTDVFIKWLKQRGRVEVNSHASREHEKCFVFGWSVHVKLHFTGHGPMLDSRINIDPVHHRNRPTSLASFMSFRHEMIRCYWRSFGIPRRCCAVGE